MPKKLILFCCWLGLCFSFLVLPFVICHKNEILAALMAFLGYCLYVSFVVVYILQIGNVIQRFGKVRSPIIGFSALIGTFFPVVIVSFLMTQNLVDTYYQGATWIEDFRLAPYIFIMLLVPTPIVCILSYFINRRLLKYGLV